MPLDLASTFLTVAGAFVALVGFVLFWRVFIPYGLYAAEPSLAEYPGNPEESELESDRMLRRMLTAAEYEHVVQHGWLDVPSPSYAQRLYRIPRGKGLVQVFERGRLIMRLCVQPTKWLPSGDLLAMHKYSIEANEEQYLRVAVRHFAYGSAKPFAEKLRPAGVSAGPAAKADRAPVRSR